MAAPDTAPFDSVGILSTSGAGGEYEDLDAMDFLRVGTTRDKNGRPVVMLISRNFRPHGVKLDRLRRYVLERCAEVTTSPYTLVWIHTKATYWANCPSMWWLWRTYQGLPAQYHENLAAAYVLHCDLNLWTASMLLLPWLSGDLWRKITWINRLEFLWDDVHKTPLPAFITEHDSVLEEQPLTDYGLIATKEVIAAGLPPQ